MVFCGDTSNPTDSCLLVLRLVTSMILLLLTKSFCLLVFSRLFRMFYISVSL